MARAYIAGMELMAHGKEREGREVLAGTVPLYRRLRETEGYRSELVEVLLVTGQFQAAWDQALADLRLVKSSEDSMFLLTYLGVIGTRQGKVEAAARYFDDAARYGRLPAGTGRRPGRAVWDRAFIAAWRGDREEAVRFLEEARAYGGELATHRFVHREPAFAGLRDYPPFQRFLKPRD